MDYYLADLHRLRGPRYGFRGSEVRGAGSRGCEFERFSQLSASFLREAGTVLIFLLRFFVSRQKNEVGFT
ncbi:MAG: hypothetical protein BWY08_00408 [Bacteroidetes bacterium ADurb.Bin174]|nr:MAG: hypothetical protein BWY08_00408 [Bacteroidetes bacterium ADurb.Bin174]